MSELDRIRKTYDAVAATYADRVGGELAHKPLDRGLLDAVAALVDGRLGDLGCGPGHVTAWLAERHPDVVGIDLSPGMVEVARARSPGVAFEVGSMTALPVADGAWGGAVALYSVIHLTAEARASAYLEAHRVIRVGGWLLVAFHVEAAELPPGSVHHLAEWWGHEVDLDVVFLDPAAEISALAGAGFALHARLDREPDGSEYPSRRCYLLCRRSSRGTASAARRA